VPSRARLRFDYRYLPSEDGGAVWRRFAEIAAQLADASPGIRIVTEKPFIDSTAMDVAEDEPVVRLFSTICEQHGVDPSPEGVPFGSDSTKMVSAGIPTIVFGPGSIVQAHSLD